MPTTERTRTVDAPAGEVWELIADPNHLPRWWPRVTRVEGVERDAFTKVFASRNGRLVRADFHMEADERALTLRWEQQVQDTPFARVLKAARDRAAPGACRWRHEGDDRVAPEAAGDLRHLGASRVRSAAGKTLDEALDGLERIVG